MLKTNDLFGGNVKSIAFEMIDGPATIGILDAGEYSFETSSVEYMTVTSGELKVMQPGETDWKSYKPFETFIVEKGANSRVKAERSSTYLCLFR